MEKDAAYYLRRHKRRKQEQQDLADYRKARNMRRRQLRAVARLWDEPIGVEDRDGDT